MPVRPEFTHVDGGSDRQPVGAEGNGAEASGSSDARVHHDAFSQSGGVELPAEEEAQPQRLVKTPYTPTKAEMAEHRANGHLPYRCWCPDCVEGFGREWAHTGSGVEREFPMVSCDDLYITSSGVVLRNELGDEECD